MGEAGYGRPVMVSFGGYGPLMVVDKAQNGNFWINFESNCCDLKRSICLAYKQGN